MSYPTVTADELRELASQASIPAEANREFQELIDMLVSVSGDAPAFAAHTLLCSECGNIQLTIAPVPMRFPAECYECGAKACFIHESAGED